MDPGGRPDARPCGCRSSPSRQREDLKICNRQGDRDDDDDCDDNETYHPADHCKDQSNDDDDEKCDRGISCS